MPLYAVVYGREWEDIAYFLDINKAKTKLIIQTLGNGDRYHPAMYEHIEYDGVYRLSKQVYIVDLAELKRLANVSTMEEFKAMEDQSVAFAAVKEFA